MPLIPISPPPASRLPNVEPTAKGLRELADAIDAGKCYVVETLVNWHWHDTRDVVAITILVREKCPTAR